MRTVMWVKTSEDSGLVYRYEACERPLRSDERDGSDVTEHFHDWAIAEVERGERECLSLTTQDMSWSPAIASFYAE